MQNLGIKITHVHLACCGNMTAVRASMVCGDLLEHTVIAVYERNCYTTACRVHLRNLFTTFSLELENATQPNMHVVNSTNMHSVCTLHQFQVFTSTAACTYWLSVPVATKTHCFLWISYHPWFGEKLWLGFHTFSASVAVCITSVLCCWEMIRFAIAFFWCLFVFATTYNQQHLE